MNKVIFYTVVTLFSVMSTVLVGESAESVATDSPWKLVWAEEFDGDSLNTNNWSSLEATYANNEQSFYAQENIVCADGTMTLRAEKKKSVDGKPYTSAAVTSQGKFSTTYGRVEARMKLPVGAGYWPAFWMLPEDQVVHGPWPACGEIDIMETAGDAASFCGTLHFGKKNNQHGIKGIGSKKLPDNARCDDFNVFAVEWEPKEMRWYCNDVLMGTIPCSDWSTFGPNGQEQQPLPAPYNKPFYIVINLAVGGHFTGNKMPDKDNTSNEMVVDYVRVYSKNEYEFPEVKTEVEKPVFKYVPDGKNIVADGTFDDSDLVLWLKQGADLDVDVADGNLVVDIDADVKEQHRQLVSHIKRLPMEKGARYRFSFKARSTKPCKHLRPVIERPDAGWQKLFLYSSLNLNEQWQDFSFDFECTETDPRANMLFYFGLMPGDVGGGKHTIYIDDVKLVKLKKIAE